MNSKTRLQREPQRTNIHLKNLPLQHQCNDDVMVASPTHKWRKEILKGCNGISNISNDIFVFSQQV